MAAANTSTLDGSTPTPHEAEDTPSKVFVEGTRIPVGDVNLHMRKEGPADFTRYCEGEFASPHNGEDYASLFSTLEPNEQTSGDTVRVDVQDDVTGNYYTAFHGLVTGVGNAPDGGENWWQFRAEGPGHRLSDVPASKPFTDAGLRHVLTYVADTLSEHTTLDVSVPQSTSDEEVTDNGDVGPEVTVNLPPIGFGPKQDTPTGGPQITLDIPFPLGFGPKGGVTGKNFQFGKHTLSDVLSWVTEKTNTYAWLEPTSEGATLVATPKPSTVSHTAHYLDGGDTRVVNNDALSELKPVNTQVVKAPAKGSRSSINPFSSGQLSDKYVKAKARHTTLYERAGGNELHADVHRMSDAQTKSEVANEATKRLKNAIDETTSGDMQTLLRGPVTPFDTIEALPTVDGRTATSMNPLTYEVSRVHHKITATGIPETELTVGVHTDPNEDGDIEVIGSWMEDA